MPKVGSGNIGSGSAYVYADGREGSIIGDLDFLMCLFVRISTSCLPCSVSENFYSRQCSTKKCESRGLTRAGFLKGDCGPVELSRSQPLCFAPADQRLLAMRRAKTRISTGPVLQSRGGKVPPSQRGGISVNFHQLSPLSVSGLAGGASWAAGAGNSCGARKCELQDGCVGAPEGHPRKICGGEDACQLGNGPQGVLGHHG